MSVIEDSLDDLLDGTPEGLENTEEDDAATDTAPMSAQPLGCGGVHPGPDGKIDLDELLAESMALQARQKKHKENLARLRASRRTPLPKPEKDNLQNEILEWEISHVWETTKLVSRFELQHCEKCGTDTFVFCGEFLEQVQRRLHAVRLVKVIDGVIARDGQLWRDVQKLPHERLNVRGSVHRCAACSGELPPYVGTFAR